MNKQNSKIEIASTATEPNRIIYDNNAALEPMKFNLTRCPLQVASTVFLSRRLGFGVKI